MIKNPIFASKRANAPTPTAWNIRTKADDDTRTVDSEIVAFGWRIGAAWTAWEAHAHQIVNWKAQAYRVGLKFSAEVHVQSGFNADDYLIALAIGDHEIARAPIREGKQTLVTSVNVANDADAAFVVRIVNRWPYANVAITLHQITCEPVSFEDGMQSVHILAANDTVSIRESGQNPRAMLALKALQTEIDALLQDAADNRAIGEALRAQQYERARQKEQRAATLTRLITQLEERNDN